MVNKKSRLLLIAALLAGPLAQASSLWSEETHDLYFGDFNGDHRTDMLYIAKDPAQQSGIVLSTSAGGTLGEAGQNWPSNYLGIPWHSGIYRVIVADFNGDGRDDIFLQRQTAGDHYLLLANVWGQFTSIRQTVPNNTGGVLWSADSHRIVAGDFNGDGKRDLFLQSVAPSGLHAVFLADATNGTFSSAQQTFNDSKFGFAFSLSKANVYSGDFNGDHKDDLFVQAKPSIVIINFDIPFPVPSYQHDTFAIVQAKPLLGGELFYPPALDTWNRLQHGADWSAANYRAVVADFDGDGRADILLQGKNTNFPNHLILATVSGQMSSTDSLTDATLRGYSQQQGLISAGNFDGTGGFGVYLQAAISSGTNQYSETAASAVLLVSNNAPSVSTPAPQMYIAFTTVTRFNVAGQVTGTISPDPDGSGPLHYAAVRNTYDSSGNLVQVETGELATWYDETVDPANWGNFTVFSTKVISHDQYGRVTRKIAKGSDNVAFAAMQLNYNSIGQPLCKAVRMNPAIYGSLPSDACVLGAQGSFGPDRITKSSYDILNQLLTETRAVGTPLEQTYVTNTYSGRLLQTQTDANGNVTRLTYDSYGRLYQRFYPSPTIAGTYSNTDYNQYTYDAGGNLYTDRKRSGAVVTYTYDALNRPVTKALSDHTYSQDVYLDYDLRGIILQSRFSSDAGSGITNTFDGFGRLATVSNNLSGANRTLSYQYDNNGNRTRISHPDSSYFSYFFDDLNRMREIKDANAASLLVVDYDANGKRHSITRSGGAGATTSYHEDNTQRLDYFIQDFASTANDVTNTFVLNPANQITQLTQSNSLFAYSGNQDRAGNYVPDGLNRYSTVNGQSISYDTNGNMTYDGGQTLGYDLENHLVASTGTSANLKYDPEGRLYEYTSGGVTTQFVYDGDALVDEYAGAGASATLTKRYLHGDRVDEPLVQYDVSGGGTRQYIHTDHLGSVIALSDSGGSMAAHLAYDSYGIAQSGNIIRFGYTGQIWLGDLGLYYFKARMYAPRLGRFLQMDRVVYDGDMNTYAYSANDPLNRRDPLGLGDESSCDLTDSNCHPTSPEFGPPEGTIRSDGTVDLATPDGQEVPLSDKPDEPGDTGDQRDEKKDSKKDANQNGNDANQNPQYPDPSKIGDKVSKTMERDGTGPDGFDQANREWDNARKRHDDALRRGDLKEAAYWDKVSTDRMIDYYKTMGVTLNPKDYPISAIGK
jgi:RHS repeat-associated protein